MASGGCAPAFFRDHRRGTYPLPVLSDDARACPAEWRRGLPPVLRCFPRHNEDVGLAEFAEGEYGRRPVRILLQLEP